MRQNPIVPLGIALLIFLIGCGSRPVDLAWQQPLPLGRDLTTSKPPIATSEVEEPTTLQELTGTINLRQALALVLMHNRGRSRDMYQEAHYDDVGAEISAELAARVEFAVDAGVPRSQIIVDPGLGFAKRAGHSYAALMAIRRLATLNRPVLVGPSRKSFLAAAAGGRPGEDEWGTAAAVVAAVLEGAHVVRVHSVREMMRAVNVADRLRDAAEEL